MQHCYTLFNCFGFLFFYYLFIYFYLFIYLFIISVSCIFNDVQRIYNVFFNAGRPRREPTGNWLTQDKYISMNYSYVIPFTEGLHPQCAYIPVYMPIDLAIAVAMYERSDDAFHGQLLRFKTFADSCPHDYTAFFKRAPGILFLI